ncbi:hypothetical protein DWW31_14170 [Clostridium sp. AF15-17LB]|nr:hypothetical protein DWW31_14170 [Clostridium sp. AF15-17LB]
MKCPRCGDELRRSSKNKDYGLCDNCRKKFKWTEESNEGFALFETENKLKTFNSDGSVTISIKAAGKYEINVDDTCIKFAARGALNYFNKGMVGEKVIPFRNITAIQLKSPGALTSGYIQFVQFGSESKGGLSNAIKDENSIVFTKGDEEKCMLELKAFIEYKIYAGENSSTKKSVAKVDINYDALKQLKELLDDGIITDDEFRDKKRQLLGL